MEGNTPKPVKRLNPTERARVQRTIETGVPQGQAAPVRRFDPSVGKPVGPEEVKHPNLTANIVRYGPPVASGFLAPSLALPVLIGQGLVAGGSEVAARRIEKAQSDPELDTLWSDLKAGGLTGALDVAIGGATRGTGAAFRWIGKKLFIPSEIPLEVRIAQETLGELPVTPAKTPLRKFIRWLRNKPASRPFSLTYGQLNGEERSFISWLEGISRAGVGSRGIMSKLDMRNEQAISDLIEQYVLERGTKLTGPEFASFAKRIIGDVNNRGEMFTPVVAYRKFLYTQFEDALSRAQSTIDGTALRQYLRESGDIEQGLPRSVYSRLRSEGLVPPLEPTAKTQRSVRSTTTERISAKSGETAGAHQRQDLLTGGITQDASARKGVDFSSTRSQDITSRETESLVGLSEEEIASDWANLPPTDVDKIIKTINSLWKDGADERNNVLKYMGHKIEDPFMRLIRSDETLNQLHSAADTFFKQEVSFMRNSAITGLRKTLSNNPSKALALLGGGTSQTPARETYDKLLSVKKALGFSSETPRVGEALSAATSEAGLPAGREAMDQMYDQTFLRPLRYDLIKRNVDRYGRLEPGRFLDMLNSNADVPEFYNEVFKGATNVEEIKKLMTTLTVLQQPSNEKNIFIQLAQAGAIGGLFSSAGGAILSDDPRIEKGAGVTAVASTAILLGPYALARVLTNTNTIRMFTDGLEQGIRSGRFATALRKIAEMKIASELVRDTRSKDAIDFYSSMD